MKDQIEFRFAITNTPFVIDPVDIRLVYKHLDGCIITTSWQGEIEVSESYETVKRKLLEHKYPHANDVSPDVHL